MMIVRNRPLGEGPVIIPRVAAGAEPQHLLLAMLGDYWFARHEPLPSAALLDLLTVFGIKESSARQSMRRLAIKGHLLRYKDGRTTSYGFPQRSEKVIRTHVRNVVGFGRNGPAWDRCFTVVAFSIPEEQRELRRELRTQLLSAGFGNLYDAVWISPHDKRDEAVELLQELKITRGSVFHGPEAGSREASTMVSEAFDTQHIRALYEEFIEEYAPVARDRRTIADALVVRTLMVNNWLTLRTIDPNLPVEVLGDDWPRAKAHQLFLQVYDALGPRAQAQFEDVIGRHDPPLAALATHYTSAVLDD